jgi:hypothetical protein
MHRNTDIFGEPILTPREEQAREQMHAAWHRAKECVRQWQVGVCFGSKPCVHCGRPISGALPNYHAVHRDCGVFG